MAVSDPTKQRTSLNAATKAALDAAPGQDDLDLGDDVDLDTEDSIDQAPAQAAAQRAREAAATGTYEPTEGADAVGDAGKPATEPTTTAPDATQAAPASAVAPDPWAEFDELEYEDDDGTKVPYRVPKALSKRARNAMTRTNIMSRATFYGSKYKPLLEPIIQQGRMDTYAGLIELAENNTEFAQEVINIANRVRMGMPIAHAQQQIATAAATVAPAAAAEVGATDDEDIFGVRKMLKAALDERLSPWERKQKEAEDAQVATQERARLAQAASVQTYQLLRMRYPEEFTGDQAADSKKLTDLYNFAYTGGYVQQANAHVDPRQLPNAILTAKLEQDNQRLRTLVETSSAPAAATIAAMDRAATATARAAGAAVAAASGGGTTSAPGTPKPGIKPVALVDSKGRRKSADQYGKEWLKTNEAAVASR